MEEKERKDSFLLTVVSRDMFNNILWNKIQNMISLYQDNYSSLLPAVYITKATIKVQNFTYYCIALSEKEENSSYYIA